MQVNKELREQQKTIQQAGIHMMNMLTTVMDETTMALANLVTATKADRESYATQVSIIMALMA